jgi:hypothetical protein
MWSSIRAAFRLVATAIGIAHEPSFVIVRIRTPRDDPAPAAVERAA